MKGRKSLRSIIYPRLALLLLLLLILFIAGTFGISKRYMLRQSQNNLQEVALLVERALFQQEQRQPEAFQQLLERMTAASQTRITIIRDDGIVVVDTDRDPGELDNHAGRPEIREAFTGNPNSVVRYSDSVHKDLLYFATRMEYSDEHSYVLRVAMPYTELRASYRAVYLFILIGAVVFIIFSAILFYLLDRMVERPLHQLAETAGKYAELDFTAANTQPPSSEEMKSVFTAMRQMAKKIDSQVTDLHHQRDALQSVLDGMKEGVFVLDRHGLITQANPAARQLFASRRSRTGLTGQFYLQVLRNSDLQEMVERTLNESGPLRETEMNIEIGRLYFQVYLSRLSDKSDQALLLVLNNITPLMHLERVRRDFVANVSHELKTPVTSIRGFAETLLYSADDPDRAVLKRFLSIIHSQSQRLEAIIDDLLTLSKLEQSEKRKQHFEPIDLRRIIEESVSICREKHGSDTRSIVVDCDELMQIKASALLIEQALINLIDNAMKYSESGSPIEIACTPEDDELHIRVIDHGFGIPVKDTDRIFERFYRIDKGRSREKGGTGLGLSIVKHIAAQHDGRVTVSSVEGEGSTFSIILPLA